MLIEEDYLNLEDDYSDDENVDFLVEIRRLGYFSLVKSVPTIQNDLICGILYSGVKDDSNIDTRAIEAFSSVQLKRMLMIIDSDNHCKAWYVTENGIVANVKVIRIPLLHQHFLIFSM
jgi:hypothetical protein